MKTLLATALMVFGLAGLAAAQSAAVVVGSIVDQTGAPLAGVRVTIRGVAVRVAATGPDGDFAFPDLPEGDYEISAELSGFERARRAVRVLRGERVKGGVAGRGTPALPAGCIGSASRRSSASTNEGIV